MRPEPRQGDELDLGRRYRVVPARVRLRRGGAHLAAGAQVPQSARRPGLPRGRDGGGRRVRPRRRDVGAHHRRSPARSGVRPGRTLGSCRGPAHRCSGSSTVTPRRRAGPDRPRRPRPAATGPNSRRADRAVANSVVLVDDIGTTGATLEAAARVLAGAGWAEIHARTVAWTPRRGAGGRDSPEERGW